jgi:hypothetical protein
VSHPQLRGQRALYGPRTRPALIIALSGLMALWLMCSALFSSPLAHAADGVNTVNLVVTKVKFEQLSDSTADYDANLFLENGAAVAIDNVDVDKAATFRLYQFFSKDGTAENGEKPKKLPDAMYNDLIKLIEWGNFQSLPAAHHDDGDADLLLSVTQFKSATFRQYLNRTASKAADSMEAINVRAFADGLDATKAFNNFVTALAARLTQPDVQVDQGAYYGSVVASPTKSDGISTFPNISNSVRYLLVETTNDLALARQISTPMLLDLPVLHDGSPEADPHGNLYIYPKTEYPVGGAGFIKVDREGGVLPGAKFALFRYAGTAWSTVTEQQMDVIEGGQADTYTIDGGVPNGTVSQVVTPDQTTDGLYVSGPDGRVEVTGLPKGKYFFAEFATPAVESGEPYSLNRWPVYFEVTDANALGGESMAAEVASFRAMGQKTVAGTTYATFPNYHKQDISLTQKPAHQGTGPGTDDFSGGIDYDGFAHLDYSLAAHIRNPDILTDGRYAAFYSIFTTQELGSWDPQVYYGNNSPGNADYHLLDIRDILGSLAGGTYTPFIDPDSSGTGQAFAEDAQSEPSNGFYYDDESALAASNTHLHGHTADDSGEALRAALNPVLTVVANGATYYYSGVSGIADSHGALLPDKGTALGGFWDAYDDSETGIARVGWYDDGAGGQSFEAGTPAGTQMVVAVNVDKLLADLATAMSTDEDEAGAAISSIALDYRLTLNPEVFSKGIKIQQFGQFEWGGGTNEENIVEARRTLAVGGANVLKVDNNEVPLGGAQFRVFHYGAGDEALGEDDETKYYLRAADDQGNAVVGNQASPLTAVDHVAGWTTDEDPAQYTSLVSTRAEGALGTIDYPEADGTTTAVVNESQIGVITLRGLNPSQVYYLEETQTPVDAEGKQYRQLTQPTEFQALAQDLYGQGEAHLGGSAPAQATRIGLSQYVTHAPGEAALTSKLITAQLDATTPVAKVEVMNTKVAPFPVTGGIGSLIFLVLGGLAIAYWFARRRRDSKEAMH